MGLFKNKINVSIKTKDTFSQNFVRINGWTYPFHWLQIIAWIFYLLMCLICFMFIVPTLPNFQIRFTVVVVKVFILTIHFITHLIAVNINPADNYVLDKLENRKHRPTKFDRSKHNHVIENQFCYICETTVGQKSKHCSLCNKCVSDFDHHCKWLNNCVGGKNYRWFIYTVLSATIGTLLIFLNCLILTIAYFREDSWLYDKKSTILFFNDDSNIHQSLQIFWIVTIVSSLVLSFIAFVLLTHLLGFHLFLNCVGLSTYELVIQQRKRKTDQRKNSNTLNKTERSKLVSTLSHFKDCLKIFICTKRRVKPSEGNPTVELQSNDKHIHISTKSEANPKFKSEDDKIRVNSDIEKAVEECGKQDIENRDSKPVSPVKSETPVEEHITQTKAKNIIQNSAKILETDENEDKFGPASDDVITRESIHKNQSFAEWKAQRFRPKTTSELYNQNEPIFRPLNPSFGQQNGRMSRLSFINRSDFETALRTVSPRTIDTGQVLMNGTGISHPNNMFVGYNYRYNKLYSNIRLNPMHKKIYKIQTNNNSINDRLEINSNQ